MAVIVGEGIVAGSVRTIPTKFPGGTIWIASVKTTRRQIRAFGKTEIEAKKVLAILLRKYGLGSEKKYLGGRA
jgi:hypothetical protein